MAATLDLFPAQASRADAFTKLSARSASSGTSSESPFSRELNHRVDRRGRDPRPEENTTAPADDARSQTDRASDKRAAESAKRTREVRGKRQDQTDQDDSGDTEMIESDSRVPAESQKTSEMSEPETEGAVDNPVETPELPGKHSLDDLDPSMLEDLRQLAISLGMIPVESEQATSEPVGEMPDLLDLVPVETEADGEAPEGKSNTGPVVNTPAAGGSQAPSFTVDLMNLPAQSEMVPMEQSSDEPRILTAQIEGSMPSSSLSGSQAKAESEPSAPPATPATSSAPSTASNPLSSSLNAQGQGMFSSGDQGGEQNSQGNDSALKLAGFEAADANDTAGTEINRVAAAPAGVELDPTTVLSGHLVGTSSKSVSDVQLPLQAAPLSYASETRFAQANVPNIVSSVTGQLLPNGGTMTLRLDPPEVGALQVAVMMKDGMATVTFTTDNPEAARMMSNTLGELRNSLHAAGITVDKMTVASVPKSETSGNSTNSDSNSSSDPRQQNNPFHSDDHRRDQQRREMLERMWRKVAGEDVNFFA